MTKIYQVFYDSISEASVDKNFIPYDNSNPEEVGWFEYSAMRNILLSSNLDSNEYLGILSPRFLEKTGMTGLDVLDVVLNSNKEVISFSPDFFTSTMYMHSFISAEQSHPGITSLGQEICNALHLDVNIKSLCQDQTRIIYANFFIAKYSFWIKWFALSEKIYIMANDPTSIFYAKLNSFCEHREQSNKYQYRVFIVERLVSLVLEHYSVNAEIGMNFEKYLNNKPKEANVFPRMLLLDALKSQYKKSKRLEFLRLYDLHRTELLNVWY